MRVVSSKGLIFSTLYVTGETYGRIPHVSLDLHFFQNIEEPDIIQKRAMEIIWEEKILVRDIKRHLFG